jgi:hypothetical protein
MTRLATGKNEFLVLPRCLALPRRGILEAIIKGSGNTASGLTPTGEGNEGNDPCLNILDNAPPESST